MNKNRIETLSDGVFAIVFTLLIIEIKVPDHVGSLSASELLRELGTLTPLFIAYVVSFAILTVFWLGHHFLFHTFARTIDRWLNLLNMLYLMFVALIPFSAYLLGRYPDNPTAIVWYGLNIIGIAITSLWALLYVMRREDIRYENIPRRLYKQAKIRQSLNIIFPLLGIALAWVAPRMSMFFFAFPVVYNLTPGSLDAMERLFGIEIK